MTPQQLSLFDLTVTKGSSLTFRPLRHPIWTENKAQLIERYLYYFVLVTKHGTYIDGFAGPQEPDLPKSWAAKLVLESEPRWLRTFMLCDSDSKKIRALEGLKESQPKTPKRLIEIYHGNFNEIVFELLKSDQVGHPVATFCLLDQRTFECEWQTVSALAAKKADRKIEQFYFVPTGWLDRAVSGLKDQSVIERWWGREDWKSLIQLNSLDRASAFCERFQSELGYRWAYAFPIYERKGGGRIMYHMIHATDHPDAPHLMARAYRKATGRQEPLEQLKLELDNWRDQGSSS